MSVLKNFDRGRRRFATGGVGMSDPRTLIPGGTDDTSGRVYHPLADADYYTYGQTGPEHTFFTGRSPVSPLQPSNLPTVPTGSTGNGANASGVAGGLAAVVTALNQGKQLQNLANQGKGVLGSLGTDSALSEVGSGAYANNAVADAGLGADTFASTNPADAAAIDAAAANAATDAGWNGITSGTLSNGLGLNDLFGLYGAYDVLANKKGKFAGALEGAAAGNSLAGWPGAIVGGVVGYARNGGVSDANPWDASGFSGLGMDEAWKQQDIARLASNPAASIASAAGIKSDSVLGKILDPASLFSKHGDEKRNMKAFLNENTVTDAGNGQYKVGNAILNKNQLQDLAGAWYGATYHPDGDEPYWKSLYDQKSKSYGLARGGRSFETGAPGVLAYASDPKFNGKVAGPGTGRSDEIPAKLSDGEYVMDAETVSMLGDGSTEAGARKLDQLRANLRRHKGRKLSRGKFSDNAKDPMEYVK